MIEFVIMFILIFIAVAFSIIDFYQAKKYTDLYIEMLEKHHDKLQKILNEMEKK